MLSRFTPASIEYTRHLWAPLEAFRLIALCGATIEAYLDYDTERAHLAIAVFLLAVMCAGGLPFTYESDARWLATFVQIRIYIRALASCFLLVNVAVIVSQRWVVGWRFRHLLCLMGICWMNTLADLGYLMNGKWRIASSLWNGIDSVTLAGSAVCYLIWIFWRERFKMLRSPRATPESDSQDSKSADDPRVSAPASRRSYR